MTPTISRYLANNYLLFIISHENNMSPTNTDDIDMGKLLQICGDLEKYQSYCHSLCEYASNPGTTINRSSVPFYILQKFAYDQKKLANIKNPEMTKFVAAIADTACLLGTFPFYSGGLWEVSLTKPTTILNDKLMSSLALRSKKVQTRVKPTDKQHQQIRATIESHVASSVMSLLKANEGFYRACNKRQGLCTKLAWAKLNTLDISAIAEDVISRASQTNLKNLGNVYLKKTTNSSTPRKKRKACFSRDGLCFSKNRSGFRLKISGRKDASSPLPGFFDLQSDLHVKCKMGLLNGTVGFGWTRKSSFDSEKTWGMFVHPPTYGY
ncbi:uncharacterized protein LOC132554232 [Ylistrum balloti]|uniref:uncharacterized protein LOC132554232 n=1 Tax=Ylistrum balloti TaxID=509963 RepID=UPI002905C001|nr:uncharacterized protein LOC132554232 [Ylistrum balloti]